MTGSVKKKEKISFGMSIKNAWYALVLSAKISPGMIVHSFFLWLFGYGEWVFFDAIFMRVVVNALDSELGFAYIFRFILISGAVVCLTSVYTTYVENVVYPLQTNRLFGGIYRRIYAKAKNVELRCYEDPDFYNRYTMAIDGAEEKISAIIRGILGTVIGSAASVIVFIFMYQIDHFAILFILAPLLGNFLFGNLKNRYELKRYKAQAPNEKVINYVSRMMYLPDGAKEIRLSRVFEIMKRQYREATEGNIREAKRFAFPNAHMNFWRITFTFTVIFEGVLLYAIYRNRVSGTITLAELTIMTSMMVAMAWILIRVFENVMEIMKNAMFLGNFRSFLDYKEVIPEDWDGDIPDKEFKSLEFRNVCFSYAKEDPSSGKKEKTETIHDLCFTIHAGDTVALVGHNGAGKTTIIKLLLRLYDPTSGTILYNGRDIREYRLSAYRELFATTFQDFQIFGMTVKDNILMGRHFPDEDERVITALKMAGVYDKVMTLKDGMNTMMTREFDKDGAVLSGGETQKIAVARTFVKESPMKIFDEPSSALDPIAEYELFKNIMKEARDHTMLFISHRLSSVKGCDKVFMLEKGTLIEEGTHEQLMEKGASYASMYRTQAKNYLALEGEEEMIL